MIVPVYLSHPNNGDAVLTYALLDTQSDTSFSAANLAQFLGEGTPTNLRVTTITTQGKSTTFSKYTNVKVKGMFADKQLNIPEAYTQKRIPVNRSHISTSGSPMATSFPYRS